ncbi:MAG TPA: GDP-fucose synthetase, partial [Chitinophagaceae bacterium]|nr:GDP-fucose synthetase [Chitinophagaceae bacterium]
MNIDSKIFVAGHRGMVGSAIVRKLQAEGYRNLVLRNSSQLNLRNQVEVEAFFAIEKPEYVFLAAAKVGGIQANNTYRADFIYENLMIEANVIHAAYVSKVNKLIFLGSSCIYPKLAAQPLKEEYLLSGYLEYTNRPYAIAKIAGIELCDAYRKQHGCDFIAAMPTNLYGPNDNYDIEKSHVLPALLRKFITAVEEGSTEVVIWGTGKP